HPLSALQSEFSLLYRVEAEAILPTLRELGISFVAYSPLGRSWLTGRVGSLGDIPSDDRRRDHPRFLEANFAKNLELVRQLEPIAKEQGCTPGQLALAWLLAQGPDIVPIPGTKRKERLEENVQAASLRLDARAAERIAAAIPSGAAAGTRYPEAQMKGVHIEGARSPSWAGGSSRPLDLPRSSISGRYRWRSAGTSRVIWFIRRTTSRIRSSASSIAATRLDQRAPISRASSWSSPDT